ncbi:MAG: YbhB/YbcL family Raf kinase inhibitor-like protein [Candidatus Babeliaceae bacterium]
MLLTSPNFSHNKEIPSHYTCDGKNISPALQWENVPNNTKSFALIVDDPDAPHTTFVHWVVFNIPAEMRALPEGVKKGNFAQGITDFSTPQYGGPCPPSGTHRYFFTLYALDTQLDLAQGATKEQLLDAIKGHVLGKAELIGLYQRKK